MKRLLMLVGLFGCLAISASAQDISGDWRGTLKAGGAELHLVLHISKDADGSLKGTLDSVDQNSFGIPVTSIQIANRNVTVVLDTIVSRFEGTLSADARKLEGSWKQSGQSLPVTFVLEPPQRVAAGPTDTSAVEGTWMGSLQPGAIKLRIVFHITDSPGIPLAF